MKDFLTVFKFELLGLLKNKVFISSTIIVCLVTAIGLSAPTIKNVFSALVTQDIDTEKGIKKYGLVDSNEILGKIEDLDLSLPSDKLIAISSIEDLEAKINGDELDGGYVIESPTSYKYVVKNNELDGGNPYALEEALIKQVRVQGFKEIGMDYSELEGLIHPDIEIETKILGKDGISNYFYTYILVFILYIMIMFYGQLIATSVASEKSNRTMEVLITSTKSSNLMFGKILGVALAGVIQTSLIIFTALVTYKLNVAAWDHKLDIVFNIPADVLISFSVFGILGYLFYAFMFGALGALVSRTEDVSASSTPIMLLFMGTFFTSIIGMTNTSGLVLKVASFVPFSSFMAMFIRISMGSVSSFEVIVSVTTLALSTGLIGILSSKIYRAGTLMYGNRVKLGDLLKILKSE